MIAQKVETDWYSTAFMNIDPYKSHALSFVRSDVARIPSYKRLSYGGGNYKEAGEKRRSLEPTDAFIERKYAM